MICSPGKKQRGRNIFSSIRWYFLPSEVVSLSDVWLCICRHAAERHDVEPPREPTHLHLIEHLPPLQPPSPEKPPSSTQPPFSTQPLSPEQPSSPTQPSPPVQSSSQTSFPQHPFFYLKSPTQPRTFKSNNPPPSRLESSLLRYTPVEYSRMLQSSPLVPGGMFSHTRPSESEPPVSSVQSGRDEVDAGTNTDTQSSPEESTSPLFSSQPRSRVPQVYSPFMKLMEITANIKIDWSNSLGHTCSHGNFDEMFNTTVFLW